jgi:hypothetical protein
MNLKAKCTLDHCHRMPLKVYSFSVATGAKWFTVMQHSSGFVELDIGACALCDLT